jgi:hypothetical protein
MNPARLQGPDHFLDILDHDMRRHGLPGNIAQLQLHLSAPPDPHQFEERLHAWASEEPACRVALLDGLARTRRVMYSSGKRPEFRRHQNIRSHDVLNWRLNTPIPRPAHPPFAIDLIEGPEGTTLALTWDHLLMDARGGEFLLVRLAGRDQENATTWKPVSPLSGLQRLKATRSLHPVFKRIGQGVAAPEMPNIHHRLNVGHLVLDEAQSAEIADRGKRIHPIVGETALLLAGALRRTHALCTEVKNNPSGYMIPVTVTRRSPGNLSPLLGNPISIVYILAQAAQMEDSTPDTLARHVAEQFMNALRNGHVEAIEKQLDLSGFLPRAAGSRFLRHLTQGRIASCFFAHTGRTIFDTLADFDFHGARVEHVFHQPMLCHPPGLGFFACRHGARLHLSVCSTGQDPTQLGQRTMHDLLTL